MPSRGLLHDTPPTRILRYSQWTYAGRWVQTKSTSRLGLYGLHLERSATQSAVVTSALTG